MTFLRDERVHLFVVCLLCLVMIAAPAKAVSRGGRAPSFTLPDIFGRPIALSDLLRGRQAVVLALGTAWSYQFPQWMEELQRLADRYSDGSVAVAAVFLKDKPKSVRLFVNRYGLTRSEVFLLVDSNGSLIEPYGIREIPRILLLDGTGTIHYDGPVDKIEDSVARLLRGETIPWQPRRPEFTLPPPRN